MPRSSGEREQLDLKVVLFYEFASKNKVFIHFGRLVL